MKSLSIIIAGIIVLGFSAESLAFWVRRRRRRCSASNCVVSQWSAWKQCSRSCGGGTQFRSRSKRISESCGGSCNYHFQETRRCNTQCCTMDCVFNWGAWGACVGCGMSTQSRSPVIQRQPMCGGRVCPGTNTRSCDTGACCPVNCVVNSWSSWSACNARCEQNGIRTRSRTIRTQASCRGTPCPTLTDSSSCRGPCCPRGCTVSSWTAWSKCTAPSGQCGANSGSRSRSRSVTQAATCGGPACPSLSGSQRCTPVPITCSVSTWGSWTGCVANNGRCGAGTQTRKRTITRNPYCSSACPTLISKRACMHSCCPVNCAVSGWGSWSSCTATCGAGIKSRTRRITTQSSCNGNACPTLKSTSSCTQYNNVDCIQSAWSSWSQCSNGCGSGLVTKTRRVIRPAVCQGRACGHSAARKACTSHRENRNCVVSGWGRWGGCNANCAVGTRRRARTVTVSQRCNGSPCPTLVDTSQCGTANGGCQHVCNNGVCSCRPGYNLDSNRKTCTAKDCGIARPRYCAPGTAVGSTCQYATVTCPAGQTTYPVTCNLQCHRYYAIKGPATITCQTTGRWTDYSPSYCRRINDPPTQILLSGSRITENQPRGTRIGTLSSVDPNSRDKHTYTLTRGGSGKFELRGADLLTLTTFNYELLPNRFDITIRSTDNGSPALHLEKTFTITVNDVNEVPTDIQLSSSRVNENSNVDTVVGMLSTADPDRSQTHAYLLLNNSGGRFKIVSNFLKVARSNVQCLQVGGSRCVLNYEQQSSHSIRLRSTDSGSPAKSIEKTFTVTVNDINDKPRDLRLSNQNVKENAPINTVIGQFSVRDEDTGQRLSFSLDNDDSGRFNVDSRGRLLKTKATDYETTKVHHVTARATDSGSPRMWISKQFAIVVQDVNEAPVSIVLGNTAIRENSPHGTRVGTVTATDKDAVQNLTITLDDNAGGKFSLETNTSCSRAGSGGTQCVTRLLVSGAIDFEQASSEMIIIRATDDKGLFHSQLFNVTVIDENDQPNNVTLEGSLSIAVNENSRDLEIGSLQTSDEDLGQSFTYILLSNGAGNFEIRGSKLFVSRSANLDYETVTSYQLRVRSTDSGRPGLSVESTITIMILDINEKPTAITLSGNTITENRPPGTLIGSLSITDPDNLGPQGIRQNHTCRLTNSANRVIGIAVNQNHNQLVVGRAGVNYEASSTARISVLCSDSKGLSLEKSFTITITDINEAPVDISISNVKIRENLNAPAKVGNLNVTDPDNKKTQRQTFTFSILSPFVPFSIQNAALVATRSLDFEANVRWTVRIRAQDSGNPPKSRTESFTVVIEDVNDRPTAISLSNSAVDENSGRDVLVGVLSTVDQDTGQTFAYTLLNSSAGRFKIVNNTIKVAQSNKQCLAQGGSFCRLNYEAKREHQLRVRSTDNGTPPLYYDTNLIVHIRDVNDQPRDLKLSNNRVKENSTVNTLIGQFASRDEDARQSMTYSLADDDGGRFRVDTQGRLYKAKGTDYETQKRHLIRAVATDNGSPRMKIEKWFTIEVLNVNEAPVSINLTSSGGQLSFPVNRPKVKENSASGIAIGTLEALDHDAGQRLIFVLDDDAGGMFLLDSTASCQTITNIPGYNTECTNTLRVNGTLDYEQNTEFSITVRATDNNGLFTVRQFRITIVDQNDAPTNVTLAGKLTGTVNENSNGALVGELVTTDEDSAQTHTCILLNDAAGRFVVRANKLYVSSSANLDFETKNLFIVTVRASDSGTPSLNISQAFQVKVLDVNEAPTKIVLSSRNITENSRRGTVIGRLNVTDPDNLGPKGMWQSHVCNVIGSQVGQFILQGDVLKVDQASLDFEQASSVSIQVKCVDNGSPSLNMHDVMTLNVEDVNETPSNISLSSYTIAENEPASLIGTLSTADPDNQVSTRQTFTYSLMGNTAGLPFVIDGEALNTTRGLNYETHNSWSVTITSTDSGTPSKSVTKNFKIMVVDVNEPPYNIALSSSSVNENSDQETEIGSLSCHDPETIQTHTYALLDGASGRFKLIQNKIKVAVSNVDCLQNGGSYCKLNYETHRQHVIRVRSTDDGIPAQSSEVDLAISITDVNDRPRDLRLSGYKVKENAPIGTKIGRLSATDEDWNQVLSYSLVDDDNGRFKLDSLGYVVKAKATDYETSKLHYITAQAKDNGTSSLALNKTFTIAVENINEAPVNISFTSQGGQQDFPDNSPRVIENTPVGTAVGTLTSLDHDAVQTLSFQISSNKFTVDHNGTCHNQTNIPGVGTVCSTHVRVGGSLNHEQSNQEDVIIRVRDNKGLSHSQRFSIQILNANDKPSDIFLSGGDTGYVDENLDNELVGVLTTLDEDVNQTHTFRLVDNGGWKFVLKGNKVYTSRYANLNYEKKANYTIVVRAIDNGRPIKYVDKSFTVQVRDVNENPTDILLSNSKIKENVPTWTPVGNLSVTDPDNQGPRGPWQKHGCMVFNHQAAPFSIDSSSGELRVSGDLNHEATPTIDVIIRCFDDGSPRLYLDKRFIIAVLDENEAPTGIMLSGSTVAENAGIVRIGMFHTVDPDNAWPGVGNQTFSYSIVASSDPEFPFSIDGSYLNTTRDLDYESKPSWTITVNSTDNKGLGISRNVIINVQDRNDAPSNITASGPLTLHEQSSPGSYIGTLSTADQDVRQTHFYQIESVVAEGYGLKRNDSSVLAVFSIESPSGKLSLSGPPLDFEQYTNYTIQVTSTDNGNPPLRVTGYFGIQVTDVNESPVNISLSNYVVAENSAIGTEVGQLSVLDPDNANIPWQRFTCFVSNSNQVPFKVSNHLTLAVSRAVLNFEQQSTFTVTVNCSERLTSPMSLVATFPINILDINEAPYNLKISNTSIPENGSPRDLVGVLSVQDPDSPGSEFHNVSLRIQVQLPRPGTFRIIDQSLVTTGVLDFETINAYNLTITATDGGKPPLNTTIIFTVHVLDENDRPSAIQFHSHGVYENATVGTVIGTLKALDQDRQQAHTITVVDHTDLFKVNGSNLILTGTLDYEQNPTINVTVIASDDGNPSLSIEDVVVVTVLNCNDPPSDVIVTPFITDIVGSVKTIVIPENSPEGTPLANLTVVDEDVDQRHVCVLIEGQTYFYLRQMSRFNASIFVNKSAGLDYETTKYPITVTFKCTDDGSPQLSIQRSFNVSIVDVNESPYNVSLTGKPLVEENVYKGEVIGNLSCLDPDKDQSHVFEVVGKYSSVFEVKKQTYLVVKDPSYLNYETLPPPASLVISIRAKDNGKNPLSVINDVTIHVIDINETPRDIHLTPGNVSVKEDIRRGQCIAQIKSKNPERNQTVTFTLLSFQDAFQIDDVCVNRSFADKSKLNGSNSTFLTIKGPLSYDTTKSQNHTYNILIRADDDGKPPMAFNGSVYVHVERVDPCAKKNNCNANAACGRVNGTSYLCTCNPGYTGDGRSCTEINECESNPCRNKGTCIDRVNGFSCACPSGYSNYTYCGVIDLCKSNPCLHNSTCYYHSVNNYGCVCTAGYTGSNCSIDIDDCQSNPCGNQRSNCTDGINQFTCSCFEGFSGTQCQRRNKDCEPNECKENEVCVPVDLRQKENEENDVCVDKEFEIPLYMHQNVFSLEEVSTSHWQYLLQQFVEQQLFVDISDVNGDMEESSRERPTDVYVLNTTTVSLNQSINYEYLRERRSNGEQLVNFTAAFFVVKVRNSLPVPSNVFYLELRSLCRQLKPPSGTFKGKICNAVPGMINRLHISPLPPRKQEKEKDNRAVLHPNMYYFIFAIGALMLLMIIVGFILWRHNSENKRYLTAMATHDRLLDSPTQYAEAMFRHQLASEGEDRGAFNPMYGFDEEEVQSKIMMHDNPLYSGPVTGDAEINKPGFANPMYQSFTAPDKMSEKIEDVTRRDDESPRGATYLAVDGNKSPVESTNTALKKTETGAVSKIAKEKKWDKKVKKKKKVEKKQKDPKPAKEDDAPDVAFVNPMFQSRHKVKESETSPKNTDDSLYSTPKKVRASKDEPVYSIPKNVEDPNDAFSDVSNFIYDVLNFTRDEPSEAPTDALDPVYVTPKSAEGAANPLYAGYSEDDANRIEALPEDIVSVFGASSRAVKIIEDDPGQSEC